MKPKRFIMFSRFPSNQEKNFFIRGPSTAGYRIALFIISVNKKPGPTFSREEMGPILLRGYDGSNGRDRDRPDPDRAEEHRYFLHHVLHPVSFDHKNRGKSG